MLPYLLTTLFLHELTTVVADSQDGLAYHDEFIRQLTIKLIDVIHQFVMANSLNIGNVCLKNIKAERQTPFQICV